MTYDEYIEMLNAMIDKGVNFAEVADGVYTQRRCGYGMSLAEYLNRADA